MACLTLSKNRKYKGTFSQRLKLWKALKTLQREDPEDMGPINGLTIRTSSSRSSTLTYSTLCYCLRNRNKVALYDFWDETPVYAIWETALNEILVEASENAS